MKMALSPRLLHIFKLSFFLLFFLLPTLYILSGRSNLTQHDYKQLVHVAVSGKKATFVQAALENDVDGPYSNSSLVALCGRGQWVEGQIFRCESPQGGIANVRNVVLSCVRFAIEAGGLSPVPHCLIVPRSEPNLNTTNANIVQQQSASSCLRFSSPQVPTSPLPFR
jgi:hypothetical protein